MMPKQLFIGTSWKMNKTLAEAEAFADALAAAEDGDGDTIQRFVIPPFTACRQVAQILRDAPVLTGAQNMHWADNGAWTGEISPVMLKDCGLDIVELGHSERRTHFGETDETVGLKVEAAIRHGLIPLVCIGETLEQKEAGQARDVLENQTRGALSKLKREQMDAPIWFAYEPVWAIGDGGIPATAAYAEARQSEIALVLNDLTGRQIPCLYGGSVNQSNCQEFVSCPSVDGLFIGRSAWQVEGYLEILDLCTNLD